MYRYRDTYGTIRINTDRKEYTDIIRIFRYRLQVSQKVIYHNPDTSGTVSLRYL
jgi:uncharacterized protein YdhG (YjbR/CyaY superfamily)